MQNIYLKPDEEIISMVDHLVQSKSDRLNLVIPAGSPIWQSSINLKLLKREADNLGKDVTLVVSNDLEAEMAQRIGFGVRLNKDFPVELLHEEDLSEGLEIEEVTSIPEPEAELIMAAPEKTKKRKKMSDERAEDEAAGKNMIEVLVQELKPETDDLTEEIGATEEEAGENIGETEIIGIEGEEIPAEIETEEIGHKTKGGKKLNFLLAAFRAYKRSSGMTDIVNPAISNRHKMFTSRPSSKPDNARTIDLSDEKAAEEAQAEPKIKRYAKRPAIQHHPFKFDWFKLFVLFGIAAVAAAVYVGWEILPGAEVVVLPRTEQISFDFTATGKNKLAGINTELKEIPLQRMEASKTKDKEFAATGEKNISERAKGYITVYNEYSSSPQPLVATTRFESTEGKTYRIPISVTIPGAIIEEGRIVASSIKVEVIADQPGEDYNIGASNFTIPGFKGTPKYATFYAKSDTPMAGGAIKSVKVVSAQDIEKAKSELAAAIKAEMRGVIEGQVPEGLKIIDKSAAEQIKVLTAPKEGTEGDKFKVEIEGTSSVLLYKEEDLAALAGALVQANTIEGKMLLPETQRIELGDVVFDQSKEEAKFTGRVYEEVTWNIDTEHLKQEIYGMSCDEVRDYLMNQPGIQETQVSLRPFWVRSVPKRLDKIKISITSGSLSR